MVNCQKESFFKDGIDKDRIDEVIDYFEAKEKYDKRPKKPVALVEPRPPPRAETPPPTIAKELEKYVKLYKMTGKNEAPVQNRMIQV